MSTNLLLALKIPDTVRIKLYSLLLTVLLLLAGVVIFHCAMPWGYAFFPYGTGEYDVGEPKNATIGSNGTISLLSPLHVEGRYIKNVLGNTVILRGVNYDGYNGPGSYGNWPEEGSDRPSIRGSWDDSRPRAHYRVLRDEWGVNAMRWTIVIEDWLHNSSGYRYWIRRGIELAQEYGIYIILTVYRVSSADWNKGCLPFPPYDNHADIIPDEQAFIDFWLDVAVEYKDLSNWLMDPYNEPHRNTSATYYEDRDLWIDIVSRLISAVRGVSDHIILAQWMEGAWHLGENQPSRWVDAFITYLEAKGANENVAISTHLYHDHWTYWGWGEPRPNTLEQLEDDYAYCGLKHAATNISYPLIVGETGCFDGFTGEEWEQAKIWWNNSLSLLNRWNNSYLGWLWARQKDCYANGVWYALLGNETWIPTPSESGQILTGAIMRGSA